MAKSFLAGLVDAGCVDWGSFRETPSKAFILINPSPYRALRTGTGKLSGSLKTRQNRHRHDFYCFVLLKEVIQPHVPVRLPCYDLAPITDHTFGVRLPCGLAETTSGTVRFRGLTGGVYKARERIHRGVLIRDY